MEASTIVLLITGALNLTGLVATWLIKVWWTNEYSEVKKAHIESLNAQIQQLTLNKEELLKSKDAHIDMLKFHIVQLNELNPVKIREYFLNVKDQLETYNDSLKTELKDAHLKIVELEKQIDERKFERQSTSVKQLEEEKKLIDERGRVLESELERVEPLIKSARHFYSKVTEHVPVKEFIQRSIDSNIEKSQLMIESNSERLNK